MLLFHSTRTDAPNQIWSSYSLAQVEGQTAENKVFSRAFHYTEAYNVLHTTNQMSLPVNESIDSRRIWLTIQTKLQQRREWSVTNKHIQQLIHRLPAISSSIHLPMYYARKSNDLTNFLIQICARLDDVAKTNNLYRY